MKPDYPGRLLKFLFRMAVIAIGLSFPVWLYLTELHPRLLLGENLTQYRALAAACDQSVRTTEMAADTRALFTPAQISLLDQSLEIGLLPCKSYAALKEYLLSEGVQQPALTALHLSASLDPSYPDLREANVDLDMLDAQLRTVIKRFGLAPLALKDYVRDPKFRLGEKLFHDPLLSGYGNRSCSTCHQLEFAMADGAKLESRLDVSNKLVPDIPARNVPDLWNRDHNDVSTMLWDGRLQATFPADQGGLSLPEALETGGFENLMALQSVRPIFIPVEMLGDPGSYNIFAPKDVVVPSPKDVLASLAQRLFAQETSDSIGIESYSTLFKESYDVTEADKIAPAQLGNALAHYIEIEFQTRDTPWDHYLTGDLAALTERQKRGALLFYGIGKCVVCHNGDVFSDFKFHSVGVPDFREKKDLGRFYATGQPDDRFLFRTPPLRNVTLTAPYFHNGQVGTLAEAIMQHFTPYQYTREYAESGEHLMEPAQIDAISPILSTPNVITDEQMRLLGNFLESLEDHRAATHSN